MQQDILFLILGWRYWNSNSFTTIVFILNIMLVVYFVIGKKESENENKMIVF